ncbi:MAG: phosphoribosyl-ATP diphosphatase [archaeon]
MVDYNSGEVFIIPKNSGLEICRSMVMDKISDKNKMQEVRGEDVPYLVEKLIESGKKAYGITGEDLYKEFILSYNNPKVSIIEKIPWNDAENVLGKPTLCLLGQHGKKLEDVKGTVRIGINRKYKKIADEFIQKKKFPGKVERLYFSGATESIFMSKIVDLVIDIVYSGKSAREAGLEVYEKIFSSDIVIIGPKENKDFTLQDLYEKIQERMRENADSSYTSKLVRDPELLKRKIIEEAAEVITAKNRNELIWEAADLIYFLFVMMAKDGVSIQEVEKENGRRNG